MIILLTEIWGKTGYNCERTYEKKMWFDLLVRGKDNEGRLVAHGKGFILTCLFKSHNSYTGSGCFSF